MDGWMSSALESMPQALAAEATKAGFITPLILEGTEMMALHNPSLPFLPAMILMHWTVDCG